MRIAIIGSGISGLTCAHILARHYEVVLFEKDTRLGGHTNTVDVIVEEGTLAVDTGFIVFNEGGYPGLCKLFDELKIETFDSDMSFSVHDDQSGVEWRGSSVASVFAQLRNIVSPKFLKMLFDIVRFNKSLRTLAASGTHSDLTLGELLAQGHYGDAFREWYLLPYGASIWSADPKDFAAMPVSTLAQFLNRHALLSVADQPQWKTVRGGARTYVDAIGARLREVGQIRVGVGVERVVRDNDGVVLTTSEGEERFDHVIVSCHSDQALDLLADASPEEKEILGAISYQANTAVLHHDPSVLPSARRAIAAWNFTKTPSVTDRATLTYNMNLLQCLATSTPVLVTLNRTEAIDPAKIVSTFNYAHPILDGTAIRAQRRHGEISGLQHTSYCGAYWGYGFHEDGVESARRVCRELGVAW